MMENAMSYEDITNSNHFKIEPAESNGNADRQNSIDQEQQANANNNQETEMVLQQHELPFYLMKAPPPEEVVNGSTNLIVHNHRQHAFKQYCCKKVKEPLSAFLPDFPGNIDTTTFFATGDEAKETSTLNSLLDPKLQVVQKEICSLNSLQLQSFRLYTGPPLPEKYMVMVQRPLTDTDADASLDGASKKSSKKSKKSNEAESGSGEKKKKKKEKKKKKDKDKDKEKKSSSNV